MAFNPDEYIASKTNKAQTGFDPDAYIANKTPQAAEPEPGFFDFFTGESKQTERIKGLKEIGSAPELNEMSMRAFKASAGLLSTGDTESLKGILAAQYGDKVSFEDDEKGNTIVKFPSGEYTLNEPGLSGQDLIRSASDMLAFTPAGRAATIPLAVGKSAATQAAIEGVEAGLGGDFTPENIALAGGLGGAGKAAESAIGAGVRAFKGVPDSGIVKAGEDTGVPIFTSDIRQPQTFAGKMAQQTGEKIPFAGTGGAREAQQAAREKAVSEVAEKYGEFSYSAISDSLKTNKDKIKKAAGNVISNVGKKLDDAGEIPLTNTRLAAGEAINELTKKGVIQSSGALDDVIKLMTTLNESPQSFSTLQQNRTAFREIISGADKAERTQFTSRAKSLLQQVENGMKKDMNWMAKQGLSPSEYGKWQKANKVYGEEARKLTKSRLKNVLDKGDIAPESVETMLFSQKPTEVKSLYRSLTPEGRQNARSAIISKVVTNLSKRQSGLTPNTFASEMGKMRLQVDEFFKGEEKKALSGLLDVLNATRRAQDASVVTQTGQQVIGAGTMLSLFTNPVATIGGGGTLGGIARLYESAPVRNALLRLDSVPKGSTQYEKALSEAFETLSAAAQTARSLSEDSQ